jgi:hypothetical protein
MATSSALDPQFKDLMPETVQVVVSGTRNSYGELSYGATTSFSAHVQKRQKMIRADNGDELTSDTVVYIYGDAGLELDSQLTLPGGTVRVVLAVDSVTDETGNIHHQIAYAGNKA